MVPFNLDSQHAAFKAKIICILLFLWHLQAPKKHARSYKMRHPVSEEIVLSQTGLFTKYLK